MQKNFGINCAGLLVTCSNEDKLAVYRDRDSVLDLGGGGGGAAGLDIIHNS